MEHREAKNGRHIWSEGSQFEECSFLNLLALVILSYAEGSPVANSTSLRARETWVQGPTLHSLSGCGVLHNV